MYSCRSCGVEDIVVDGRREKKRGSFGWMFVHRASPPRKTIEVAVVVGGNAARARRDARREKTGARERRNEKYDGWEKGCPAESNCGRPRTERRRWRVGVWGGNYNAEEVIGEEGCRRGGGASLLRVYVQRRRVATKL